METFFSFPTKADARRFVRILRNCCILTTCPDDYSVEIYNADNLKDKERVLKTAQKTYEDIMGLRLKK